MALELDILREIRDDVKGLRGEVHGVATKVTQLETKMNSLEEMDHERRLRDLENNRAWVLGWAAGVAGIVSIVVFAILKMVGK